MNAITLDVGLSGDEGSAPPLVTIGMPVYNGAATLAVAVESAVQQTYKKCIIHISDNASSDGTQAISAALAQKYGNVVYTRHAQSLGLSGNFRYVLDCAKSPFFMWLASDDCVEPRYIERTLAALQVNPDWIACSSRTRFVTSDGRSRIARTTSPLLSDCLTNLFVYLSEPSDNSRVFALHRTELLREAIPRSHFHAYDYAIIVGMLMHGKYGEVGEVLMVRDETPPVNYIMSVHKDNRSTISRFFPLLPVTKDILFRLKVPLHPKILGALVDLNIMHHIQYMMVYHPNYAKATERLWRFWSRYVSWRLRAEGTTWYRGDHTGTEWDQGPRTGRIT